MSAISPPTIPAPDWDALALSSTQDAATALRAILARLAGIEERTFAMRGRALLLVKERELFRLDIDLEVGRNFESMDRWIKGMYPKHHRYYQESLTAAENLREMAFEDFAALPRCNVRQLEKTSSKVRLLPEVIEAAKNLPEKEFVAKLNRDHQQHLEEKRPVIMADKGDVDELENAIEIAMVVDECKTRAEAIRCIAVAYVQENGLAYQKIKGVA